MKSRGLFVWSKKEIHSFGIKLLSRICQPAEVRVSRDVTKSRRRISVANPLYLRPRDLSINDFYVIRQNIRGHFLLIKAFRFRETNRLF
jgi:hypothetical protein